MELEAQFMDAFTRRRLFLAIKEMLNNTVKYADASLITISFEMKSKRLEILVTDDGAGFDMDEIRSSNGVRNIKKIMEDIQGSNVTALSDGNGTRYCITIAT